MNIPADNPNGEVFLAQGGINHNWAVQYAKDANLRAVGVLDDLKLTVRFVEEAGVKYAVARFWSWEPHPGIDNLFSYPREHIKAEARKHYQTIKKWWEQAGRPVGIHFQLNCEQSWWDARNVMYVYMIEACIEDNVPFGLVVGNYADGAVKAGQGVDPNWWKQAGAVELIKKLHNVRHYKLATGSYAFLFGFHWYTGLYWWSAANGGNLNSSPLAMPGKIDWTLPQWHLGRGLQGIMQMLKDLKLDLEGYLPPWIIVTEALIDNMNDIIDQYVKAHGPIPLTPGYDKAWGYNSLIPFWKKLYPDLTKGQVLAQMQEQTWEIIFAPLGYVVATLNYSVGNTGMWHSHNTQDDNEYFARKKAYRYIAPGTPTYPDMPAETDSGWDVGVALLVNASKVNIRKYPDAATDDIGDVLNGEIIRFHKTLRHGEWMPIGKDPGAIRGWVSTKFLGVDFIPAPEPEPEPEPTSNWKSSYTVEELKSIAYAQVYAADATYPEPSAHYKKLVAKLVASLDALEDAYNA